MVSLTYWVCFLFDDVLAPRLAGVFRRLLRLGSFLYCQCHNIPKGPPSSFVANYRPISLIPMLSKIFERLVSVLLGRFMECRGVLPTTQFAYKERSWHLWCSSVCGTHLTECFGDGREARSIQIDFIAAFDRVNQQLILFKLYTVGVGDSVLSVLTEFLTNRSKYVVVDGCRKKLVNVVTGVPQGTIVSPVYKGAFLCSGKQALRLCWRFHFNSCCAIPR